MPPYGVAFSRASTREIKCLYPLDILTGRAHDVGMTKTAQQYEIIDSVNPDWRGMRFSSLDRAQRELAQAVGTPGRFYIIDRQTGERVS